LRVREVETGVEMRAGETLAIAGLVQTRVEGQNRGIPFLGDLPIIGTFFSARREQVNEIETLIMVTPQFVEAMPCEQVPPGGPGLNTQSPSDCQFYLNGHLEVPLNPDRSAQPGAFPPPGPSAVFVPDENGGAVMGDDLIGLPPGAVRSEVVPAPAEGGVQVLPGAASQLPEAAEAMPSVQPMPEPSAEAPAPADSPTPAPDSGAARRGVPAGPRTANARSTAQAGSRVTPSSSSGPSPRQPSATGPNLRAAQNLPPQSGRTAQNRSNRPVPTARPGLASETRRPGLIGPSGYDVDK